MRRTSLLAGGAAIGLASALVGGLSAGLFEAKASPTSLLPPGFDDPAPTPTPAPSPTAAPPRTPGPGAAPPVTAPPSTPSNGPAPGTVQPLPQTAPPPPGPQLSNEQLNRLPTVAELEDLSTDQLDDLLGLKPKFDIPPAARRSLSQVGVLDPSEGGMPISGLARQPANLVRAILMGTSGPLVSRWGHILTRRVVVSRIAAPDGMDPVEFAALRTGVLNSLGEFQLARAMVQDVDTGNWNTALTSQALTAYIANADPVGVCPAVRLQGGQRDDPQWKMLQAICNAYAGESALAGSQLDAALGDEIAPDIDILLAQRFAGAAGRGRRGVNIDWEGVEEITPWRFALANAVGTEIPQNLLDDALEGDRAAYYSVSAATAPMIPLAKRALYAGDAARSGVLSSQAMVSLYSEIFSDESSSRAEGRTAASLRAAYVAANAKTRIAEMRNIWSEDQLGAFPGQILTAYAAARIAPSAEHEGAASELIASMLTAGLDRDAAAWRVVVGDGSLGWALIALSDPQGGAASEGSVDEFISNNGGSNSRKSAFLVAGLAGLDRLSDNDFNSLADTLDVDFNRQTRWTTTIERAAELENTTLVALLAGLGMQGQSWEQMTPLHLYHITSALNRVGLSAEARMIAAEAVARG